MKISQNIKTIFFGINTLVFLFFSCENPDTKTDDYSIHQLESINTESIKIDSLYIQVAYKLQPDRILIVGKNKSDKPEGLSLLLLNPEKDNKLIFQSRGAWESWTLHPTIFKSKKASDPTVILASMGTSESWGQRVYLMNGDSIKEIGFMDVTNKESADTSFYEVGYRLTDIAPYTEINLTDNSIDFSFKCDSVFYYGSIGDDYDITFAGDELSYHFDGDSLMLKVNAAK